MHVCLTVLRTSREPFIQSVSHLAGASSHTVNAANDTSGIQAVVPFRTGTALVPLNTDMLVQCSQKKFSFENIYICLHVVSGVKMIKFWSCLTYPRGFLCCLITHHSLWSSNINHNDKDNQQNEPHLDPNRNASPALPFASLSASRKAVEAFSCALMLRQLEGDDGAKCWALLSSQCKCEEVA